MAAGGVQSGAVYTAHVGADTHLSGDPEKLPISRGVPIAKAMTDNVLIAFAQNGGPLHPMNGAPLRLVVPGWPGSCSQEVGSSASICVDIVHDGPKMTGTAYRVPGYKVEPGEKIDKKDFVIIERIAGQVAHHESRQRRGDRAVHRGARACLVGRQDGQLRSTSPAISGRPGRRPNWMLPQATARGRTSGRTWSCRRAGILRSLGSRHRQRRLDAAPRHRLEPEGVSQQHECTGWRFESREQ